MTSVPEEWDAHLSERDKQMIDSAWEKHKNTPACDCGARDDADGKWGGVHTPDCAVIKAKPDWPPRASAHLLPDGFEQRGSTGQLWRVSGAQWERVRD